MVAVRVLVLVGDSPDVVSFSASMMPGTMQPGSIPHLPDPAALASAPELRFDQSYVPVPIQRESALQTLELTSFGAGSSSGGGTGASLRDAGNGGF
jgi:hypothetical protein